MDALSGVLLDVLPYGVIVVDVDGFVLSANDRAAEIFSVDEVDDAVLREIVPWMLAMSTESTSGSVTDRNGVVRRVSVRARDLAEGRRVFVLEDHRIGTEHDGEGPVLAEWYRAILARSQDLLCVFDRYGRMQWASQAAFGYKLGSVTGAQFTDFVHPDDLSHLIDQFVELFDAPGNSVSIQLRIAQGDGSGWIHVDLIATNYLDDPAVGCVVASVRDVTSRAEATARLEWHAFHDSLTGLLNRTLLLDRIQQASARAERRGQQIAILFFDLDMFKAVNDVHGHHVGDEVLREVARRIETTARAGDTVARLGGDEFVVVTEDIENDEQLTVACERFVAALAPPIETAVGPVHMTASIGVSLSDGRSPEVLLRSADTALYDAKAHGGGTFQLARSPDHDAASS